MRILYLTQWFDPEPGVIKGPEFVQSLLSSGYEIDVVTGIPNYPGGKVYPGYKIRLFQKEKMGQLEVRRLPLYPSHDGSAIKRAANYLSFFASALMYGLWSARRYDACYVYHPPITVGLAAAIFCGIWRKPFILEIQDLWPDTVAGSGMAGGSRIVRALEMICNFVYRRAARIIVQSEGMSTILIERGVPAAKLHVVRNWADQTALQVQDHRVEAEQAANEKFTFVYGGNLGKAQALQSIVRAAKRVADNGVEISVKLIGTGIEETALKQLAIDEKIPNVEFIARVPKEEIGKYFARADCLLMHLADLPLFAVTLPSKTQFYLASARPILAGVSGEAADILNRSCAAGVVKPEDEEAIAEAMIAMAKKSAAELAEMGDNGRQFYRDNLSFKTGMTATLKVIQLLAK